MNRAKTLMTVLLVAIAAWTVSRLFWTRQDRNKTELTSESSDAMSTEHDEEDEETTASEEANREDVEETPSLTEEEKAEAAAEAKVSAFDDLVDKLAEPVKEGITLKDVETFVASFRNLPKDRRDECIHRALNLIPDENVMVLVGVLMDKKMDAETAEAIFADILNRDEKVKMPILRKIQNDATHPCHEEAKWLLDATAEE